MEKTYVCVNGGGSVIDLMIGYGEIAKQVEFSWIEKSTELYSGAPQRGHYPIIYSLTIKGYKEEKKRVNDYNNTDASFDVKITKKKINDIDKGDWATQVLNIKSVRDLVSSTDISI